MKKRYIIITILLLSAFFRVKNTYAYSVNDYSNRVLCGTFEVAEFFSDGSIVTKSCHSNFDEAKNAMNSDGGDNLALLGPFGGTVKILDANAALVDFTNPTDLIYLYKTSEIVDAHSYMTGKSTYGAVDGALVDSGYSHSANTMVNRVKIGGFDGWVRAGVIEIVPLVWVKSSSSYTITNESIRHNYVSKIQNTYSGSSGNTIGPKPSMLDAGTYYSYDGHYFYKDLLTMVKDYKNNNYNNSVNKDKPYYNYYQFLPQHTRTTYSSINIDEYIRNNLGYKRDVYGTTALNKQNISTSRLYGQGAFFYNAQELYGANALLSLSVSRNESGNGRSNLSINKNNGFGLNAVDSNPTQAANYFATFSQSILDYSNVWVTYGYSEPTDWRYFGAQNGNKEVGMNVKYASDVYWGEKMASNYYNIDKAYGFQDYNFYQTAVTTSTTQTYSAPTMTSKAVYNIKNKDAGLVIVEEVEGQEINGNKIWYKIVSDMNIDENFNQKTSGYYNWNSYVYIPAAYVLKTNEGKNGYISPNETTEYIDKNYSYDLFTENGALKPKVAVSTKETIYHYDPSLQSTKGQSLLKNRYVMVFAAAYDANKKVVSYLVTSDYKYNQKHWVSADSIRFVTSSYGQANVTVEGTNTYTIINPDTVDDLSTHISGLYHYTYVPILEEKTVGGVLWYKVPVDLSGDNLEFGWTLASAQDVLIQKYQYTLENTQPVINATDKEIIQGKSFDELEGVTANDTEDGDITKNVKVISNSVDTKTPGKYTVTYQVTDSYGIPVTKSITVTVIKDEEPVISANDITTTLGKTKPNLLENVTATDKEDGKITTITADDSKVKYDVVGEYQVTYIVKDSYGHEVTKTIKLIIKESMAPVIYATDKTITIKTKFNELEGVTAKDAEDGDITKNIKVIKNTVNTEKTGNYEVTYQITDSNNQTTEITIKVSVIDKEEKKGRFDLDYLKKIDGKLNIKGYSTIDGINNDLKTSIDYKVILVDINTSKEIYEQALNRIINEKNITYTTPSIDGKDYQYSWFEGNIDISKIPNGDYVMYIYASTDKYYSKNIVNNQMFSEQLIEMKQDEKYLMTRNNYFTKDKPVELLIRSEKLGDKNVSSLSNQYGQLEDIKFTDDSKLYIYGNAFTSMADLGKNANVTRKIIFENIKTFEKKSYNLGAISNGEYVVKLPVDDKLSKEKAWYKKEIDISDLPKGKYSIYIQTISNVSDIGELNEQLFRDLSTVTKKINNKKYTFSVNYNQRYRVELTVE